MTTFARVPPSRPSCVQGAPSHCWSEARDVHAMLAVCALQTHLEALCQLLHVCCNIRMCALTHGNAVQARASEEVRIIHLGDRERMSSGVCKSTHAYTCADGGMHTSLKKSV